MTEWWSDLIETVPAWLETLKSPNGLYKMSASAFHDESLDATSLALDLRQMLGLSIPPYWDVNGYFSEHRVQSTGFYHESYWDTLDHSVSRILEMSGTYFGFQVAGLLLSYDLQFSEAYGDWYYKFYEQFLRPGAMSHYMTENMPWDTAPMGAGNMVDAAATMMRMNIRMGHFEYWHVVSEMYQWLDNNRDRKHGFWGSLRAQGTSGIIQAAYHILRGMHFQDSRRLFVNHRMLGWVISCLLNPSAPLDACHYMDCAVLLEHLSRVLYKNDPPKAVMKTAKELIDDIRIMRRDDGAFSFSAEGAITNHNRYEVTPGNMESDLVGTVFYLQALRSALHVLGEEVPWGESATHGVRR